MGDLLSKENLSSLLHVGQDHGADILGAENLGSLVGIYLHRGIGGLPNRFEGTEFDIILQRLVRPVTTNHPLGFGVLGVDGRLALGWPPRQDITVPLLMRSVLVVQEYQDFHHLFHLVAVLFLLVSTGLLRLKGPDKSVLHHTYRLQRLLLALVTDLSALLLAVSGVAVLLSLLGVSLYLHFADLLWLKMAVLLLDREGEDAGKLPSS